MAPPKERKRRFHRRSKNGCQSCKRRHVRCDEQKPLCTNCLQSGSDCIYPIPEQPLQTDAPVTPSASTALSTPGPSREPTLGLNWTLNDYVGGYFNDLPDASKRLLQHFSQYAVHGQRAVARDMESSLIQRGFEKPGYMHICLMFAACQWAWVTGSMDTVQIPFLYHKAATYQFVREQLQRPETAQSGDTMLAISALALAEGAIGELDASSQHLKGIHAAMSRRSDPNQGASLPQQMLKMIGNGLRTGRSGKLVNVPDYQPTFMALLFASIWDITALPPREAPRYGWWEETDTQAARLWQNHTRDLNLDYEISRGFNPTDPTQYIPRILNGDPRSSRTSFIATFFYLCSELGHRHLDVVLIDWLLEQLIDDVNTGEEYLRTSTWTQPLLLWCVMFGAAIAWLGKATNAVEDRQLQNWRDVYDGKIRMLCRVLGINSWYSARTVVTEIVGTMDADVDRGLQEIWNNAVARGQDTEGRTINPAVIELGQNP